MRARELRSIELEGILEKAQLALSPLPSCLRSHTDHCFCAAPSSRVSGRSRRWACYCYSLTYLRSHTDRSLSLSPFVRSSEFEGILEKTPAEANAFLADPEKYIASERVFHGTF